MSYGTETFTALNYHGAIETFAVRGRIVFQNESGSVTLMQVRKNRFVVVYGLQVSSVLDYATAAKDLGECIMHDLCYEGLM